MDIKCRKTQCRYNDRFVCQAKKILIDKNHFCKTCEEDNKKEVDTSKLIFLENVEYAPFRHCKNIDINCDEKCLFNNEKRCEANGILVNVDKDKAKCMTYILP